MSWQMNPMADISHGAIQPVLWKNEAFKAEHDRRTSQGWVLRWRCMVDTGYHMPASHSVGGEEVPVPLLHIELRGHCSRTWTKVRVGVRVTVWHLWLCIWHWEGKRARTTARITSAMGGQRLCIDAHLNRHIVVCDHPESSCTHCARHTTLCCYGVTPSALALLGVFCFRRACTQWVDATRGHEVVRS